MKKSKFLKKSLAMLLALMLVVAMIPLSAAAAGFDLTSIYVGGNKVELASTFTVDVPNTEDGVVVHTNEKLSDYGYKLVAVKATSTVVETEITDNASAEELKFADYAPNGSMTLKLYDISSGEAKLVNTYTMNLNKTSLRTTTNLASVTPGNGVYSATFDNDAKTVSVVLARQTDGNYTDTKITVVADDGAKVVAQPADAADGTTFEVESESGNNISEYTIKATYADAITSFSVNGVEGVISDSTKDNIPDTITVTLPKTAILDKYGDPTVETFDVEYAVYGDVTVKTNDVKIGGTAVASGKSFTFTGLAANGTWGTDGNLMVTRLNTASQTYKLVVELEKSDNTAITAARLDNTEATIDGDKISAVLPVYKNNDTGSDTNKTKLTAVKVELTVDKNAKSVVINGTSKTPSAGVVTFDSVDLTKPQIVTVTAQDNTTQQYTLSATKATEVKDASITAMWLTNGATKAEGVISGNTITLTVPYMTTSVAGWNVYVTPSAGAKVLASDNDDVYNGETKGSDLGLNTVDVVNGATAKIKAVNKADQKVFKEYNVVVKLAPAKNGNTLTDLDFTAQKKTTMTRMCTATSPTTTPSMPTWSRLLT